MNGWPSSTNAQTGFEPAGLTSPRTGRRGAVVRRPVALRWAQVGATCQERAALRPRADVLVGEPVRVGGDDVLELVHVPRRLRVRQPESDPLAVVVVTEAAVGGQGGGDLVQLVVAVLGASQHVDLVGELPACHRRRRPARSLLRHSLCCAITFILAETTGRLLPPSRRRRD